MTLAEAKRFLSAGNLTGDLQERPRATIVPQKTRLNAAIDSAHVLSSSVSAKNSYCH